MSLFLREHPDHRIGIKKDYQRGEAWCSCGWSVSSNLYGDAETAAGKHFSATREKRFHNSGVHAPMPGHLMPSGLSFGERQAYRKGWDTAARKFIKDHGLPSSRLPDGGDLGPVTAAYNAEREPLAHKAGMAALGRYQRASGAPVSRRRTAPAPSHCPSCGHDLSLSVAS